MPGRCMRFCTHISTWGGMSMLSEALASNSTTISLLITTSFSPHPNAYWTLVANPCKAVSFIRYAAKMRADMMTFDNSDELYKIARAHPRAKVIFRILTDDSESLWGFGIKFRAPLVTVPGLLTKAKALNLGVVGVSFHVGSGCYDPSVYTDAIMRARAIFNMGKDAGYTFSLLDVGGGFEDSPFEQAANYLNEAIEQFFPDRLNPRIIAEPGRSHVSKAFRLAPNIIARRAPIAGPPAQGPSELASD